MLLFILFSLVVGCELRDGNCYDDNNTTYITSWLSNNLNLVYNTYNIQTALKSSISLQPLYNLHISYNYLCNYTSNEMTKIHNILKTNSIDFKPYVLKVHGLGCNYDNRLVDRKYLHFLVSPEIPRFFSKKIEKILRKNGITIKNPHAISGPKFHITIATLKLDYNITHLLNTFRDFTINVNFMTLSKPWLYIT
jgi:hypothetical protein